jgi:hypothetical protein
MITVAPPEVVAESNRTSRAALLATADPWVRVALGHLILEGVPREERRRITALNVARLYQFDA